MCLVWLTEYFKHIRIGCQYFKIGHFHSKSQISSTSGELRRCDISGPHGCLERLWGNYCFPLEGSAPLPRLTCLVCVDIWCMNLTLSKRLSHLEFYYSTSDLLHYSKYTESLAVSTSTCMHAKSLQACLTLRPYGLYSTRLYCPWVSPGKYTRVGCHALLQRVFPTQGLNHSLLCLLHWQVASWQVLGPSTTWESPPHPQQSAVICPYVKHHVKAGNMLGQTNQPHLEHLLWNLMTRWHLRLPQKGFGFWLLSTQKTVWV